MPSNLKVVGACGRSLHQSDPFWRRCEYSEYFRGLLEFCLASTITMEDEGQSMEANNAFRCLLSWPSVSDTFIHPLSM